MEENRGPYGGGGAHITAICANAMQYMSIYSCSTNVFNMQMGYYLNFTIREFCEQGQFQRDYEGGT